MFRARAQRFSCLRSCFGNVLYQSEGHLLTFDHGTRGQVERLVFRVGAVDQRLGHTLIREGLVRQVRGSICPSE